jgi:murein DD-endopeptidase MepM/ murein hydrolase activator NlpD
VRKRGYTVVVMPPRPARTIGLHVPPRLMLVAALLTALLVVGACAAIYRAVTLQEAQSAERRLQTDTLRQRVRIQQARDALARYKEQLHQVRELDRELRLISNLDVNRPAPSVYGVGGPGDPPAAVPGRRSARGRRARLVMLDKEVAQLQQVARYEDASLSRLETHLDDEHDLIEHTPYRWPVHGFISSGFGPRTDPFTGGTEFHEGLDIVVPKGTDVQAPADGIVTFAGRDPTLGNMLVLDHGYGVITRYGHLSAFLVHAGRHVRRGDAIARVGSTGRSTGPHLHYEIRINDVAINPLKILLK